MTSKRRLPTSKTTNFGRLLLRGVRKQTHQRQRRAQHADGHHHASKVVCAQIPRLAHAIGGSQITHQRIHMVDGKGTRNEEYDNISGSMGRGDEYGMQVESKPEEDRVFKDYALSMQLSNQNLQL